MANTLRNTTDVARNPVKEQDRVADLFSTWQKYGYLMFPQQRRIYQLLAWKVSKQWVLEAGCGTGQGSYILGRFAGGVLATDISPSAVEFAKCLYPRITVGVWDISKPWHGSKVDVVVCVETIEHVEDAQMALTNLIGAATETVWVSTPNDNVGTKPPSNPYHVQEYTPKEMCDMILLAGYVSHNKVSIDVLSWEDLLSVPLDTKITPLVYKVML